MAPPDIYRNYEVVDLLSDSGSDDEGLARHELEAFDARSAAEFAHDYPDLDDPIADFRAEFLVVNDHELIDLTNIPDIDVPPSDPIVVEEDTPQPEGQAPEWGEDGTGVTEAACLQMVLSVLPDISVDYVLTLIQEKTTDNTRTMAQCEHLLMELLEGEPYPKESDEAKKKKRKWDDGAEDELSTYEKGERDPEIGGYEHDAIELLKDEFLNVPVRHITNVLQQQKTLYKAYGVIERQVRDYGQVAKTFSRINKSRNKRGIQLQLIEQGSQIPKELHAAKKKSEAEAAKRQKLKDAELAEEANLQQAQMNSEMGECACCFNDVPLNRMVSCNGDTVHLYCVDCPRQQIETLMGQSRCRPKCFGVDDCNGTFTRRQLQQVLSDTTFERLEHMQQREDLEAAGLDFLSECPFCDFKMECLPVEVDKEFRCQNPKCGKTSCRLCEKDSHIPLSCEEFKKDGQITLRHIVEEAMSAALIRHCNKCKHPFIKELGCNKMTCTHCRNVQCYVCSKNVTDYNHFGEALAGKCPLHENIEDRHEQEVKRAADEAMAKVRADNPDLSDADLMVKVSDRVKQAEDARKGRATVEAQAFPYHMVGEQLRRAPIEPPVAAMPAHLNAPPANFAPDRYVHPYPAVVPIPAYGHPVPPLPLYQPFYPVQHVDYYGAVVPHQPYQQLLPLDGIRNMVPPNPLRQFVNEMGQVEGPAQQANPWAAFAAARRPPRPNAREDLAHRLRHGNHLVGQYDREAEGADQPDQGLLDAPNVAREARLRVQEILQQRHMDRDQQARRYEGLLQRLEGDRARLAERREYFGGQVDARRAELAEMRQRHAPKPRADGR